MSSNDSISNPQFNQNASDEDILSNIDFEKIFSILKKSAPWVLLIFILCNVAAFMYVRYTKPVYESLSTLKLDIKSESGLVGVSNPLIGSDIGGLSGEIELLRSNLFFGRVADEIDMDVSYHFYGRYLSDERYGNSPFEVEYVLRDEGLQDRIFDVEILDDQRFMLEYGSADQINSSEHRFEEEITTDAFDFRIKKTENFSIENGEGRYYFTINSRQAVINYLKRSVAVEPLNLNAKTISVSLKDFNKYKARELLTAIDTLYLDYNKEIKNQAIKQKIAFVESQINSTEEKLESYETYFEDFTIENRTVSVEADIAEAIGILDRFDTTLFEFQNKISAVDQIIRQIERGEQISIDPFSYEFFPPFIISSLNQYKSYQTRKAKLLDSYNENTLAYKQLENEAGNLSVDLVELIKLYKINLANSRRELTTRQTQIGQSFLQLPSMGTEYNKQRRSYGLELDFFISLIKSKSELEIARAGTVTNFVILSPPNLPGEPIHPQKLIIYGIGLVASIFLSIFFIAIRYLLHTEISGLKELERLVPLPILGSVPAYKYDKKTHHTQLVIHKNPKSIISEAMRSIRTNMDFMKMDNGNRIISITSTVSGEGKTFVSVNLAGIIALSHFKVVILDLDLRKAKVHLAFGDEKSEIGVSTVLINRHPAKEAIRKTIIENLDYMPAGPIPPNPSELLISKRFDELIEELKKDYDYIMMDTPPVGLVTDGMLVMQKADLPIYIVRAGYSRKAFANTIRKVAQVHKFNNLSLILNGAKTNGAYGYGSGYGYGYGYGHGYYEEDSEKK
ncbi:MAG: polysaccharide biosynthesis tyrosine autokinase [Cyclobacteriaceae bacterium]